MEIDVLLFLRLCSNQLKWYGTMINFMTPSQGVEIHSNWNIIRLQFTNT